MAVARTVRTSIISSSRKTRRSRAWTAPRFPTPSFSTNTPLQADAFRWRQKIRPHRRARNLIRSVVGDFLGKKSRNPHYGIGFHGFETEDSEGQEEEFDASRGENRGRMGQVGAHRSQ